MRRLRVRSPAARRRPARSRLGSRGWEEAGAAGRGDAGGGGRAGGSPRRAKRSRMRGQRGACAARPSPRTGGSPPPEQRGRERPCRGQARRRRPPDQAERSLGGQLGQGAATLGLQAWHPLTHLIPSLRFPGYLKPQLFLEVAPAMIQGEGKASPRGGRHSHSASSLGLQPLPVFHWDAHPFYRGGSPRPETLGSSKAKPLSLCLSFPLNTESWGSSRACP